MSMLEELQSLDMNDPGRWPLPVRVVAVALVFVGVSGFGAYSFVFKTEIPLLERVRLEEQELRTTFEQKQRRAANFDAYVAQLAQIEERFSTMRRQLPAETEVPELLEDVAQTALAAGLEEELWDQSPEVLKDFYAELPIKVRYRGGYHELANFVSGVALLPRIVTLHNISIGPRNGEDPEELVFEATARTYRYIEENAEG